MSGKRPRAALALWMLAGAGCAALDESTLADVEPPRPQPVSATGPLGLDEVGRLAVRGNPDLAAARAALGVTDAEAFRAGLWPDPAVGVDVTQPILATTGDTTGAGVSVDWDLGALVTKGAEQQAALLAADAARMSLRYRELVVAGQARLQAARVVSLEEQETVARAAAGATDALRAAAEDALTKGDATVDDVALKQAAALDAETRLLDVEAALAEARGLLARALGLAPDARLPLAPVDVPPVLAGEDAEHLFALARTQRADLVALRTAYRGQQQTLRAAVLAQFPRLSIHLEGLRDPAGYAAVAAGIGFDAPVFDGNRGNLAVERATGAQLAAEYAARLAETRADIAQVLVRSAQSRAAHDALVKRLPRLREAEAALRRALATHDVTTVAWLEVQKSLLDAELRLLALEEDQIEERLALQTAVGAPLPIGTPPAP